MDALRILLFEANPFGDLKLDEEIRAIDRGLQSTRFRDAITLLQSPAARAADLISKLSRHQPQVVHFSGHGVGAASAEAGSRNLGAGGGEEGQIVFVGDDGAPQMVSQEALSDLFAIRRGKIRLVVLNACFTRSHAEAICVAIDCVIGTNRAIGDKAARVFSERFYQSLGDGGSVQQAFNDARVELKLQGIHEADTPVLMTRRGIDPSQVVLIGPEPDPLVEPKPETFATQVRSVVSLAPRRWAAVAALAVAALVGMIIWRGLHRWTPVPITVVSKPGLGEQPKGNGGVPSVEATKPDSPSPWPKVLEAGQDPREAIPWLWENETTIKVGYLNGSREVRDEVTRSAKEWTQHANLKFDFIEDAGSADIRVAIEPPLATPGAYTSFLGTQAKAIPSPQPTMILGFTPNLTPQQRKKSVLWMFGHALGLISENTNPNCRGELKFKIPEVYRVAAQKGYSTEMTDRIILGKMLPEGLNAYRSCDPYSIMMIPLEKGIVEPFPPEFHELSEGDKAFVRQLYPPNTVDPTTKPLKMSKVLQLDFSNHDGPIENTLECGFAPKYFDYRTVGGRDPLGRITIKLNPDGDRLRVIATERKVTGDFMHVKINVEVQASNAPIVWDK
jgi:CHAT domain